MNPLQFIMIDRPEVLNALHAEAGKAPGFVNEVLSAADLMPRAMELAEQICQSGPLSVRASKEVVLRIFDMTLEEGTREQWDFPAMVAMQASKDVLEGPVAFTEKRLPRWLGR